MHLIARRGGFVEIHYVIKFSENESSHLSCNQKWEGELHFIVKMLKRTLNFPHVLDQDQPLILGERLPVLVACPPQAAGAVSRNLSPIIKGIIKVTLLTLVHAEGKTYRQKSEPS